MEPDQPPELFGAIIVCNDGTMVSQKTDCKGGVAPEDVKLVLVKAKVPVAVQQEARNEVIMPTVSKITTVIENAPTGKEEKKVFSVITRKGGYRKKRDV
jgi:hypothetical protein